LGYGLLGLIAYGFFMLVQFPASVLADWLTRTVPALTLQQVSGSAIQGGAQNVRLQDIRLPSLTWRMRVLPLLLGRLEYRVSVSETDVQLDAVVGTGLFNQHWRVTDMEGQLPVPKALSIISQIPAPLNGEITFANADVSWDNEGAVYAADGTVGFVNTRTTFADPFQIGSFNAELSAESPNLLAAVEDSGGPLEFSGMLSLAPDGGYQLVGRASLRDTADNRLRDTLNLLGQSSGDGQWQLDLSGVLGEGLVGG
jgi:hypothetical protein